MSVLVLTCEQDVTADLVVARLLERSVPVVRLDPADLPGRAALSAEYVRGEVHGYLSVDGRMVSTAALRGIWVRRPGEPAARAPGRRRGSPRRPGRRCTGCCCARARGG